VGKMVNFGSRLNNSAKPEWTSDYVCYDKLKELIAGFCAGIVSSDLFVQELEASLVKIDQACSLRETQLKNTKEQLALDLANVQTEQDRDGIKSRLAVFSERVDELRHYVNWNYMAVIKIVKKRNKNFTAFSNYVALDAEAILLKHSFYTSGFVAKVGTFITLLTAKLSDTAPDRTLFSCAICLDELKNPVSLACNHRFCFGCIQKCVHSNDQVGQVVSCALCRRTALFNPESFKVDTALTTYLVQELGFKRQSAPVMQIEEPALQKPLSPEKVAPKKRTIHEVDQSAVQSQQPAEAEDLFLDLESFFEMEGFEKTPDLRAIVAPSSPLLALEGLEKTPDLGAVIAPNIQPVPAVHEGVVPGDWALGSLSGVGATTSESTNGSDKIDDAFQLSSENILAHADELLRSPEIPQPVNATRTGRRRRMIPIKELDKQTGLDRRDKGDVISNKLLKTNPTLNRARNRNAAQIYRIRDQQYVSQLEELAKQLEQRKADLTLLESKLLECKRLKISVPPSDEMSFQAAPAGAVC